MSGQAGEDRYRGRPLVLVLENYVLAAIGELPPDKHVAMGRVVRRVFGGGGDWMATVRQKLQITRGLEGNIRTLWSQNRKLAEAKGAELLPDEFARLVVEENFAPYIEPQEPS